MPIQPTLITGLALATRSKLALLVEHYMDAVLRLADRISVLVNGRIITIGALAAVRNTLEVNCACSGEEMDT